MAASATAAPTARISYADTVEPGASLTVTTRTHASESFQVVLRIPRGGRAFLYLRGRGAPRGGALIDTSRYACRGSGRYRYCRAAYEPLPAGVQRWQVRWLGV